MDRELQLIGNYGLRNKREVWRAQLALATIRKKARSLLVLDEKVSDFSFSLNNSHEGFDRLLLSFISLTSNDLFLSLVILIFSCL